MLRLLLPLLLFRLEVAAAGMRDIPDLRQNGLHARLELEEEGPAMQGKALSCRIVPSKMQLVT